MREELAANLPTRIVGGMDVDIPEPPKQLVPQVLREVRGHTAIFRTPGRERDDDGRVLAGGAGAWKWATVSADVNFSSS